MATLLLGVTHYGNATQPEGPVSISTMIDFQVFGGTFDVSQGSELLGCSAGTFRDTFRGHGAIEKKFTCELGGAGTFTFLFKPIFWAGHGDLTGHWEVWRSDGDFAGLRGQGSFSILFSDPPMEFMDGYIHFEP